MEFIGNIPVPEIIPVGTFPIVPDYPFGRAHDPQVIVHQFGSGDAKIEQRFFLGDGAKRFTVRKAAMRKSEREALRDFWEARRGPYGAFTYDAPDEGGAGTTPFICRFANEPLSWQMISDRASSVGVTLIEIPDTSPSYPLNETLNRFPSAWLAGNLLTQVQQLIPLVKIQPLEPGYPLIYLSDRRCTIGFVGGQLYLARLLDFDGISQTLGNAADEARFTFGNADRVMRDLANDVDLFRAAIEFSLFHVATGIKLDLWKGDIVDWSADSGPEFHVTAADGLYELNLPYPTRTATRSCWKTFNDPHACPFSARGAMDLVHFPSATSGSCDKGYETPNGCLAHGMKRYYGGILLEPEGVRVKDNSTGVWGFRRSAITSVSLQSETICDQVIPEVYTDTKIPVNSKLASGRDESDFYEALGVVCEGPITFGTGHRLDGQYHHGYPGWLGLRQAPGGDPAGAEDWFSLDWVGDARDGDWRRVFNGYSTFKDNFAAGTAFLVIRRSDEKGLQLSRPDEHSMEAVILQGLRGWIWTSQGSRYTGVLTNPIWIVINMLLRARGLRFADIETCERYFDVDAAIEAAAICDLQVAPFVPRTQRVWVEDVPGHYDEGTGEWVEAEGHWEDQQVTQETQFKFRGVLQEQKPLRDWIQEVLMNCLADYTFAFGKLKPSVRVNSSVREAFTLGNILFQSLELSPLRPSFNHLTANFADEEFDFANNAVSLYDIDHAKLVGGATSPLFLKGSLNLAGSATKSQAGRIVTVRLREELGGTSAAEWKKARRLRFRTTVLALNTEPGTICSLTHPDMPEGAGEFRATSWRLNRDFSIDIEGRTTTDSMYNLVGGPKPADVQASAFPKTMRDLLPRPPFGWMPYHVTPLAADPIFDPTEWTFGLAPQHEIAADGTALARSVITGKLPVNVFSSLRPPLVSAQGSSASVGGSVRGGRTYYAAVCAKDAGGRFTVPSSGIAKIAVPAGADTNVLKVAVESWPDGAPGGYAVFAGENRDRLSWQQDGAAAESVISISGPLNAAAWGMPDGEFDRLRLKVKKIYHSGVFGQQVLNVTANSITVAGAAFTPDQWAGYVVSILALYQSTAALPILNYRVLSNDETTLTLEPGHDPATDGVKLGDVIIMRFRPTIVTETTVNDPNVQNCFHPTGANPDEEAGRLIRIIAGKGRGQVRKVVGNTATVWTVDRAWDVIPDTTSIFIVEEAKWEIKTESTPIDSATALEVAEFRAAVENLLHETVLVQAVAVDGGGHESPDGDCPLREIYLFGVPGAFVRDYYLEILLIEEPIAAGEDVVSNRGRIRLDAYTEVGLDEVSITAKTVPGSGSFVADILTSQDGSTWTSIFPDGAANKAVLPQGAATAEITVFRTGALLNNDLLRVDVLNSGGALGVTIEVKGKVVTTD